MIHPPRNPRPRSRAFALYEMMIYIVLLTIIAAVAGKLFYQTILALQSHQLTLWEHDAREHFISRLREEAWSSSAIATPSPNEVVLTTPTGPVRYVVYYPYILRMIGPRCEGYWQISQPPQFTSRGPLVDLTFPAGQRITLAATAPLLQTQEAH